MKYILIFLLTAIIVFLVSATIVFADSPQFTTFDHHYATKSGYEQQIINDITTYRASQHLPTLIEDSRLCAIADERVGEIKTNFSHDIFVHDTNRLHHESGDYHLLGENLAMDFKNPMDVVPAWLASPKHKENLDIDYTHDCVECDDNYCVHILGK